MLIPLDDRPACMLFPTQIAAIAGSQLDLPPHPLLGNAQTPGQPEALIRWLHQQPARQGPRAALIASDMLCYGGLVASRTTATPQATALARLQALRGLKHQGWSVRILATLPRLSLRTSDAQAPYENTLRLWAKAGGGTPPPHVPTPIVDEYLAVRRRNVEVVKALVDLAAEGCIDQLWIGQDDSSPKGINRGEQQEIAQAITARQAGSRAHLLSGADELAMDMVCGWLSEQADFHPRLRIEYSDPSGPEHIPDLESTPLATTVAAHLEVVGAQALAPPHKASADAVLRRSADASFGAPADAPPHKASTDATSGAPADATAGGPADATLVIITPPLHKPRSRGAHQAFAADYAHRLHELLDESQRVGLADLEHVNLADPDLANAILSELPVTRLECYAGWNTASNSLGTALAQTVAHCLARRRGQHLGVAEALHSEKAHQAFLFARLVDDFWFQAVVRAARRPEAAGLPTQADPLLNVMGPVGVDIRTDVVPWARRLFARHFQGKRVALAIPNHEGLIDSLDLGVTLPWKRVFEVEVRASLGMHAVKAKPQRTAPTGGF